MKLPAPSSWSALTLVSFAFGIANAQDGGKPVPYKIQTPPLDTDWTSKVGTSPWPQYPRPQLRRDVWQNLNGIWTWQAAAPDAGSGTPPTGDLEREVLVPSCIESGLSGLQQLNVTDMWFARSFKVSEDWKDQPVVINFDAVDYKSTVFVNGAKVGSHVGGYDRFSLDISKQVKFGESNSL